MTTYRKVKRAVDGDTLELYRRINGSRFVRLANVNKPELYQFGGIQARDKLNRQVKNEVVTLQPVGASYGRTVAKVRYNRRLLR